MPIRTTPPAMAAAYRAAPPPAGISDATDDAPGYGRGGYRGTGLSDADPHDAPGRGRGGYRRVSDSDPYDAPGRGRRGW